MTSRDPTVGTCLDEDTGAAWLTGQLAAEDATRVEAHLDACPECHAVFAEGLRGLRGPSAAGRATGGSLAATTFAEGETLANRYRILRFIARGGMGEVYEALDLELGERLALKSIAATIADEPRAVHRLKAEVHLARRITHPNVCRLYDLAFHERQRGHRKELIPFFTMELLEGESLGARIRRAGRMNENEALPIIRQMAAALAAAHRAGVIHRDFKSDNVIIVPAGNGDPERAVVTDFGLARVVHRDAPVALTIGTGAFVGTVAYMSPEQVEGHPVTPASDVYSLGVVLFEMMTGQLPFVGTGPLATAVKRLKESPPLPRTLAPDLSPGWETMILRCLERRTARRFRDAEGITSALGAPRPVRPSREPGDTRATLWTISSAKRFLPGPRNHVIVGFFLRLLVVAAPVLFQGDGTSNRGARPATVPRTGSPPRARTLERPKAFVFVSSPELAALDPLQHNGRPRSGEGVTRAAHAAVDRLRDRLRRARNLEVVSSPKLEQDQLSWTVKTTFTPGVPGGTSSEGRLDYLILSPSEDVGLNLPPRFSNSGSLRMVDDAKGPFGLYYDVSERVAVEVDRYFRRWRATTESRNHDAVVDLLRFYGERPADRSRPGERLLPSPWSRPEPTLDSEQAKALQRSLDHDPSFVAARVEWALFMAGTIFSLGVGHTPGELLKEEQALAAAGSTDGLIAARCVLRAAALTVTGEPDPAAMEAAATLCRQATVREPIYKEAAVALAAVQRLKCDAEGARETLRQALEVPGPRRGDVLLATLALALREGWPPDRAVVHPFMGYVDSVSFGMAKLDLSKSAGRRLLLAGAAWHLAERRPQQAKGILRQALFPNSLMVAAGRAPPADASSDVRVLEEWVLLEGLIETVINHPPLIGPSREGLSELRAMRDRRDKRVTEWLGSHPHGVTRVAELLSWVAPAATSRVLRRFPGSGTCLDYLERTLIAHKIGEPVSTPPSKFPCRARSPWLLRCKEILARMPTIDSGTRSIDSARTTKAQ